MLHTLSPRKKKNLRRAGGGCHPTPIASDENRSLKGMTHMGIVFKPYVTRPLPAGARLKGRGGKRVAVWTDGAGKKFQALVTAGDSPRIRERAGTYTAQFKDGDGVVRRVSTGCRSLDTARAVLADLERRAEQVKAGIVTQAEVNVAGHADTPVAEHVDAYLAHLERKRGKGARLAVNAEHLANVRRSLRVAVEGCGFRRLRDLNRDAVERWVHRLLARPDNAVVDQAGASIEPARLAARTLNIRLCSLTSWGNWLVEAGRLTANPFARLRKIDESDDVRRQRRALTAEELRRLLTVARLRPVAEHGRQTLRVLDSGRPAKSRATWTKAELTFDTIVAAADRGRGRLRPEVLARLERAGRERALLYAVLVTTGLRKGELAALTTDDVLLDGEQPAIMLRGADAKSGQRAALPLRADVAAELKAWLGTQSEGVCRQRVGVAGTVRLRAGVPLLYVPTGLIRILDRDLRAAGIPKLDDRGRSVDVHAMRSTFGTLLAAAGVTPVVLKQLMRHKRIETTLKHYVDPRLLDVAGAVASLPAFAENAPPKPARATGTESAVALGVALNPVRTRQFLASAAPAARARREAVIIKSPEKTRDSRGNRNSSGRTRTGDTRLMKLTALRLKPMKTSSIQAPPAGRCTRRCTETPERLDELARAVALVASMPLSEASKAEVVRRLFDGR